MMFTFYHTLAIAAVVKNEALYILEWLYYHRAAGVTKFYIYDNGSTDGTVKILQPFVRSGEVELIACPLQAAQLQVYQDAIARCRFTCKYLAVIDIDEFLLPVSGKSLPDEVELLMEKYPAAAGIAARWRCFGSSGEKEYRPEEVLHRFCRRAEDDFKPNRHIKSIFNPRLAEYMPTPHHVKFIWGRCLLSNNGEVIPYAYMEQIQSGGIFTYHYFVKSEEEFLAKLQRGTADGTDERTMEQFTVHDRNEVYDDSAWRYFMKWQVMPFRGIDREAVEAQNRMYLQEIMEDAPCSLTEVLCHFFTGFAMAGNGGVEVTIHQQQLADLLLTKISNNEPVPMEQILLLAEVLPELLNRLDSLPGGITEQWKKSLNDIFDDAIYVARTFYQLQEVRYLRYIKAMLPLTGKR